MNGLVTSNVHLSKSISVALLWSSDSTPIETQDVGSDEPNYMFIDLVAGMRRVAGYSGSVHQVQTSQLRIEWPCANRRCPGHILAIEAVTM